LPRRPAAGQRLREAGGPAQVAAHRPRVQDLDAGDRGTDDVPLEAGTDHLDLGQLGHGWGLGLVRVE
jgi:hypothetical protein